MILSYIRHKLACRRLERMCEQRKAQMNSPHSVAARKGWATRREREMRA